MALRVLLLSGLQALERRQALALPPALLGLLARRLAQVLAVQHDTLAGRRSARRSSRRQPAGPRPPDAPGRRRRSPPPPEPPTAPPGAWAPARRYCGTTPRALRRTNATQPQSPPAGAPPASTALPAGSAPRRADADCPHRPARSRRARPAPCRTSSRCAVRAPAARCARHRRPPPPDRLLRPDYVGRDALAGAGASTPDPAAPAPVRGSLSLICHASRELAKVRVWAKAASAAAYDAGSGGASRAGGGKHRSTCPQPLLRIPHPRIDRNRTRRRTQVLSLHEHPLRIPPPESHRPEARRRGRDP